MGGLKPQKDPKKPDFGGWRTHPPPRKRSIGQPKTRPARHPIGHLMDQNRQSIPAPA